MTSGPAPHSALRIAPITTRAVPIRCPHCTGKRTLAWIDKARVPEFLCPSVEATSARYPMVWIGHHVCDLWPVLRAAVSAANRRRTV